MDTIRVGMVGAGWIAQEHRRVLCSMADAELAAVCDIDPERAGSLAVGTGARTYSDWRDLLDHEDLGALIVCTPPRSHRDPAVAALSHDTDRFAFDLDGCRHAGGYRRRIAEQRMHPGNLP